jgi:hypothetical protein
MITIRLHLPCLFRIFLRTTTSTVSAITIPIRQPPVSPQVDPDSAHQMTTNFYTASYTLIQTTTATIATWLYPLEQNSTATIWRRCASCQAHPYLRTSASASFAKRTSTKRHTTWWLSRLVRTSSTASASSVGPRATARSATPVPPAAWSCISMYR